LKPRTTRGFTIIELLVVIAIIGLLIGVMYPAITSARMSAKKTKELNLIGQVSKAWSMYSLGHQERLLPGYLSTQVQGYRELAWAFTDETIVWPAPTYDLSLPNDAGPWTWRLLDYLDNDWESLLFYRDVDWDVSGGGLGQHANVIATQPAFGYNGYYIGGLWEIDDHSGRPVVEFSSVTLIDDRKINVVSTVTSHIKKPHSQLVFCSTFFASAGVYADLDDDTAGSYLAIPSNLARVDMWEPLGSGRIEAHFDAHVPLGRFNGLPAIAYADGHVNTVGLYDLVDQRLWIPKAQDVNGTPASEFSHTQ
jgi:prepilin-type N-terminal cleavage/methylation domain-containing protein